MKLVIETDELRIYHVEFAKGRSIFIHQNKKARSIVMDGSVDDVFLFQFSEEYKMIKSTLK